MEQVPASRSELLSRRARLELARGGRNLLEEKRDQLMSGFRRAAETVVSESGRLDHLSAAARRALALAEASDGPHAVRTAAAAAGRRLALTTRPVVVGGVRIAEVDFEPVGRERFSRGYPPEVGSSHIDAAADEYEAVVEQLLRVAAYEVRLRRLAEEIALTNRRVNALSTIVIPELEADIRLIVSRLEERERQEIYRLKQIKQRKATRPRAGSP